MHIQTLDLMHSNEWASLLATCFQRPTDVMQRHLDWLHSGYPVVAFGVWENNTLVAQYACLCIDLHLPGQFTSVKAGMSLNMCVHPDFRGRGLIKQVAMPVYETLLEMGAVAGVGFSNAQGVKVDRKSKGYGYQVVGKMQPVAVWLHLPHYHSSDFRLSDTLPPPPWSVDFSKENQVCFSHSVQSVTHRYPCHPDRAYKYGVWQEGDQVHGIVVYRNARLLRQPVASLLAAYSNDLQGLVSRWAGAIRHQGTHILHTLATPNAMIRNTLDKLGMTITLPYSRNPYYLTAKPLNHHTPSGIFDFATWDCTGGDIL